MWSSWLKEKVTTQVMCIAKLKDGPKWVKKTFSMILERVLKWYDVGGENGITSKRIFEVEVFFSSQDINFPFIWRDSWSFYFSSSFSLSFFSLLRLLRGFDDIWGENHFVKNFFSSGVNILTMDAYSRMELCTPTWLNHDYGDAGVVDILVVDTYSRVELCTPIFLGEASK
jgi:hypothetical protein